MYRFIALKLSILTATTLNAESTPLGRYHNTKLEKHPSWLKAQDAIKLSRRVSEARPNPSSARRLSSPRRPPLRWSAPSANSEDAHPFAGADHSFSERKRNPPVNSISDLKPLT